MPFNPEAEYTIVRQDFDIQDFHKYEEDFITRPAYQRKNVWKKKDKQALMDSLFRRYYIPRLVIREIRLNSEETVKEIIDGQQRITTVQDFFENRFKLPDSLSDIRGGLAGKYYRDLSTSIRKFIDKELKYQADIIKNIEDPENVEHQIIATEIFWRLQQGKKLNFMEVAHAQLSSLSRNFVVKYSDDIRFDFENYKPIDTNPDKHPFFSILNVDNTRMKHLLHMTRFSILEEANGYADLNKTDVEYFINKYKREDGIDNKDLEEKDFAKEVIRNLDLFYNIFKDDPVLDQKSGIRELSTEYFIVSFYLLIRHLRNYYVVDAQIKQAIRNFLYDFFDRWKEGDEEDSIILAFSSNNRQRTNDLKIRDRILRQLFFEYLQESEIEIVGKDSQRVFNEAQRIKIYRRDKGFCQACLEEGKPKKEAQVSWSDYQADHVLPHSKGGKSILDNAQVLCQYHNQSKGAKDLSFF